MGRCGDQIPQEVFTASGSQPKYRGIRSIYGTKKIL